LINQVTLVGRLTKDPELKITVEGISVTNVTLAVNRHYRNQNGMIDADFVQCTLWRKVAENTVTYCRKGSVVGITGRIQTRHYENGEGRRVYVTEVVAESVQFIGKKQMDEEVPQLIAKRPEEVVHSQPIVQLEQLPFAHTPQNLREESQPVIAEGQPIHS
jgi:single-strand DNA-binding protein